MKSIIIALLFFYVFYYILFMMFYISPIDIYECECEYYWYSETYYKIKQTDIDLVWFLLLIAPILPITIVMHIVLSLISFSITLISYLFCCISLLILLSPIWLKE
jgi:hypothetical protein